MRNPTSLLLRSLALLALALVTFVGASAYADPVSYWLHQLGSEEKVDAKAREEERVAREGLIATPGSRALLRDLGDALHFRGHFAEHVQLFEEALPLHRESMAVYRQSGLTAHGSWGDGTEHADEHIFMNLFDSGLTAQHAGNIAHAEQRFEEAHAYLLSSGIDSTNRWQSGRIAPRYAQLAQLRQAAGKSLTPTGQLVLQHGARMMAQQQMQQQMQQQLMQLLMGGRMARR